MQDALQRLEEKRGVKFIRADTATARSFEYNAERIIEAIESTKAYNAPFGLIGYSQGCANSLMAESLLYSGTPAQQEYIKRNLACRQLLFSAANGSSHGAATDKKATRLVVMLEEFAKYQQGYLSRAMQTAFLETVISALDSSQFHKSMGGAQGFLYDGCRAFWREAQHLPNVSCSKQVRFLSNCVYYFISHSNTKFQNILKGSNLHTTRDSRGTYNS
jgi:hypothetical protein